MKNWEMYNYVTNDPKYFLSRAKDCGITHILMNSIRFKIDPATGQWTRLDLVNDDSYPGLCPNGYIGCEEDNPCSPCANAKKQGCSHIFRQYVGFSETYKYCTICDLKQRD